MFVAAADLDRRVCLTPPRTREGTIALLEAVDRVLCAVDETASAGLRHAIAALGRGVAG